GGRGARFLQLVRPRCDGPASLFGLVPARVAPAALSSRARTPAHGGIAPAAVESGGAGAADGRLSRGRESAARTFESPAGAGAGRAARRGSRDHRRAAGADR